MDRPFGITLVALLNFAIAGVCLLVAVGGLNAGIVYFLASLGLGGQFGAGTFLLIGGAGLVVGLVSMTLGIGLWKVRNRIRQLQITLLFLLAGFELVAILGAMMRSSFGLAVFRSLILGVEIWILIYLFTPRVKRAFGAAPHRTPQSSPYDS